MRYRDYKIFRSGQIYHVYNRGNNKNAIFLEPSDFEAFIKRMMMCLNKYVAHEGNIRIKPLPVNSFRILAYTLMPNHYHFIIMQCSDINIDRLITKVCTSYSAYFNRKYKKVGHLFQGTFKAKHVDSDAYMIYLSAYIHNNPQDPLNYPYSSFHDIINERKDCLVDTHEFLKLVGKTGKEYKKFVLGFTKNDQDTIADLLFDE